MSNPQTSPATGQQSAGPSAAEQSERMKRLSEELRCLVCQNQTLADSNAELAVDLKRQIETLMREGRSDDDIRDYMVARYGDFVLYKPPVQRNTWVLWFGPFAMLASGGLLWWLVQRRSRLKAAQTPLPSVQSGMPSADALARARDLLGRRP
jgi:cytochrome c-type biogenesis protein CcmH